MTIRPAHPSEAAALTDLAIRSKASWGYDAAFMEKARPDMLVSAGDIERAHCLLAEEHGTICGYVLTFIDGEYAFLRDLFIEPAHFKRGLGSDLFRRAIDEAKARGAHRLTLHADPNARAFYEHFGMHCTGETPSIIGNGRTLPIMQLVLC